MYSREDEVPRHLAQDILTPRGASLGEKETPVEAAVSQGALDSASTEFGAPEVEIPRISLEQLAQDIRDQPESVELRMSYARALSNMGHAEFADFIEAHILYSEERLLDNTDQGYLDDLSQHVSALHKMVRRRYFLPPAEPGSFDIMIENGLQMNSDLVVRQYMRELWVDKFGEKGAGTLALAGMIPFSDLRLAFELQPLCGISLSRGLKERDILANFSALSLVSEIFLPNNPADARELLGSVLTASDRLSAMVLEGDYKLVEALNKIAPEEASLLRSLKFHSGQIQADQIENRHWNKGIRSLEFRDVLLLGDHRGSFAPGTFPNLRSLTLDRSPGSTEIIAEAISSDAFPRLEELWVDEDQIESLRALASRKGIDLFVNGSCYRGIYAPYFRDFKEYRR
jgi:hypothetical protein